MPTVAIDIHISGIASAVGHALPYVIVGAFLLFVAYCLLALIYAGIGSMIAILTGGRWGVDDDDFEELGQWTLTVFICGGVALLGYIAFHLFSKFVTFS